MEAILQFLTNDTTLNTVSFFGLCITSFFASLIATSIGLGGGLLVLATMTLVLPPAVLILIHGLVQIGSNGFRAWLLRKKILFSIVPAFVLGSLIGAVLGGFLHFGLQTWFLQLILGVFVLYATWSSGFKSSRSGPLRFFCAGGVSGFVTMFVGATGPLVAPFVRAACDEKQEVVSTHAMLMTFQHGFKVLAFGALGFGFGPYIPLLVGLIGFGMLGTLFGRMVLKKLPEHVFRVVFQTVISLLAIRLLYSAASSFFKF